jgi:hypothetical protein
MKSVIISILGKTGFRSILFLLFGFIWVGFLSNGEINAKNLQNQKHSQLSVAEIEWEEYADPHWAFSLSYPKGWSVQNLPYRDFGFRINSPDLETDDVGNPINGSYLSVDVIPMTLAEWKVSKPHFYSRSQVVSTEKIDLKDGVGEKIRGNKKGIVFIDSNLIAHGHLFHFSFNQAARRKEANLDIGQEILASVTILGEPESYPRPDYAALGIELAAFDFPEIKHAFQAGPGEIINGYDDGNRHTGSDLYALDLCEGDGCTEGVAGEQVVIAPTDFTFIKTASNQSDYQILEIDNDGSNKLCMSLAHFYFNVLVINGTMVPRGAALGFLSDYDSIPHIHIGLWTVPADNQCNELNRTAVPFDAGAGGFSLDGVNYPIGQEHEGKSVTSTNGGFCWFPPESLASVKPSEAALSGGLADCFGSALDLYMIVDLSGSFTDDLPYFKSQAPGIISSLKSSNPNSRFGLGSFEDYPITPFGDLAYGDVAYRQNIDLTFDSGAVEAVIEGLFTRYGVDGPQSQLPALYQAASGAGQDLSGAGYPEASIPPGQQANFRDGATKIFMLWTDAPFHQPGDPGAIPYPGPSFDTTVDSILALDPPKVIGISSGGGGVPDLEAIAAATGAIAPLGGVDCNADGTIDIAEGDPLVCSISSSGEGIGEAIRSLVEAAAGPNLVEIDIKPGSDPNSINCNIAREIIPVAILTTETFDATTVDHTTVAFEGATEIHVDRKTGVPIRHEEDIDLDGDLDLVFHFRLGDTDLICGSTEGTLLGETFDGLLIRGTDAVQTVPPYNATLLNAPDGSQMTFTVGLLGFGLLVGLGLVVGTPIGWKHHQDQ